MSATKSNILGAMLAIFSSIALFRLVIFIFQPATYVWLADISLGVTTGHPGLKTFQSRVLGPYLVKWLSFLIQRPLFGSPNYYVMAHVCFHIAAVALAAFLCWRLGKKYGGNDQSALLALTLFVTCFALLLSPPYLYSWDFIDIIVFIVFIDFVLSDLSLPWFLGLFSAAIWNRDSALFIALWLILDPVVRFFYQHGYKPTRIALDWRRMLAGAFCIVVGLVLTESLNRMLFKEQTKLNAYFGSSLDDYAGYSHINNLSHNIHLLEKSLTQGTYEFWIVVPAFLITVMILGGCLVVRDPQRYLTIYLIEIAMVLSLFIFGRFYETRIYLILIPFVVVSSVLLNCSRNAGTKTA
jgi:hypothetical protein